MEPRTPTETAAVFMPGVRWHCNPATRGEDLERAHKLAHLKTRTKEQQTLAWASREAALEAGLRTVWCREADTRETFTVLQ